jgi:hypothetical protein
MSARKAAPTHKFRFIIAILHCKAPIFLIAAAQAMHCNRVTWVCGAGSERKYTQFKFRRSQILLTERGQIKDTLQLGA